MLASSEITEGEIGGIVDGKNSDDGRGIGMGVLEGGLREGGGIVGVWGNGDEVRIVELMVVVGMDVDVCG